MRTSTRWRLSVAALLAIIATACTGGGGGDDQANVEVGQTGDPQAQGGGGGDLLEEVQSRGTLRCGVNDSVPGFGFVTEAGEYEGFDIEFCRVIAAGVIGDASAVEFVPLTAEQRFTALQSGEVDVLVRNTTWTATRDGTEGAQFAPTTFYDGQGIFVRADSDVQAIEDLAGATICVLSGTTTELNLESQFRARGLEYTPLAQEENETLLQAFIEGRCDAYTSDKSQLAGLKSAFPEAEGGPEAIRILDVTLSKEPLGPVVAQGDPAWLDAVSWSVLATIQAEEFGITSQNIDEFLQSDDPSIQAFLGQATAEGNVVDPGLGLPTDFAVQIIEQVGNYAEIYASNVGPETPLGLPRGLNALWTEGGLLYAPPYR